MKKVKLLCAALAFPLLAACGDDAGSFAGQGNVTSLEAEPSAVISAAQEMASPSPEAEEDSGVSYPYCSDEGHLADMMARWEDIHSWWTVDEAQVMEAFDTFSGGYTNDNGWVTAQFIKMAPYAQWITQYPEGEAPQRVDARPWDGDPGVTPDPEGEYSVELIFSTSVGAGEAFPEDGLAWEQDASHPGFEKAPLITWEDGTVHRWAVRWQAEERGWIAELPDFCLEAFWASAEALPVQVQSDEAYEPMESGGGFAETVASEPAPE